ncbi:KAP family P-loop NTPase fold protein [Demequina iriomotensis]|uniref:KAP family P-loop NTPase fold protein n=1 Tax=Demequina iriomotensis TaxID=1536641 RepID=UPI000783B204|nr:P-loop NTPase fold protein [Demequina iriomotensis]
MAAGPITVTLRFARGDDLDAERVMQALEDVGIRARTRPDHESPEPPDSSADADGPIDLVLWSIMAELDDRLLMEARIALASGHGLVALLGDGAELPASLRASDPVDLRGWLDGSDPQGIGRLVTRLHELAASPAEASSETLSGILDELETQMDARDAEPPVMAPPLPDAIAVRPGALELLAIAAQIARTRGDPAVDRLHLLLAAIVRPSVTRLDRRRLPEGITYALHEAAGSPSRWRAMPEQFGVTIDDVESRANVAATDPLVAHVVAEADSVRREVRGQELWSHHLAAVAVRDDALSRDVLAAFGVEADLRTVLYQALLDKPHREDLVAWARVLSVGSGKARATATATTAADAPATGPVTAGFAADAPNATDTLGRSRADVEAMAALLASQECTPPLAVAVFGEWGAGKSSFMRQLESSVRGYEGRPGFVSRIRQVTFNAWHYAETDLLASLLHALWVELADVDGLARPIVHDVDRRIAELQRERDDIVKDPAVRVLPEVAHILAGNEHLKSLDLATLGTEVTGAKAFASRWRVLRARERAALVAGALVVAAAATWAIVSGLTQPLAQAAAGVVGALAFAAPVRAALRRVGEVKEARDRRLAAMDAELTALELRRERLATASAVELAREFIGDAALVDRLGLHAVAQDQLRRLFRSLARVPGTERIVLYVDDLDRCRPDRVIEVLETVHLLLAESSFVVIVAVDPRWLERSLVRQFPDQFARAGEAAAAATTVEYLEKIFQIAYRIPDFRAVDDYDVFVRDLVGPLVAEGEPATGAGEDYGTPPEERRRDDGGGEAARKAPSAAPTRRPRRAGVDAVPRVPAPELAARALQLTRREVEALATVMRHLGSPRNAVRLVNLYRLIRATADPSGTDSSDSERGCLVLLLAAQVALPEHAGALFARIEAGGDAVTLAAIAHDLADGPRGLVEAAGGGRLTCADAGRWLGTVRRYAFHTAGVTMQAPPA